MKKTVMLLICLAIQLSSLASIDTVKMVSMKEGTEKNVLTSSEVDQTLKTKVDLLEKHEGWVLSMLGIGLAFTAIILGLIQWYLSKKAEDNVFRKLGKIADGDKEAFREAVKMKSIELDLMSNYPIFIVSDEQDKNCNSKKLLGMLKEFHFDRVDKLSYAEAGRMTGINNHSVIIFCDPENNQPDDITEDANRKKDRILMEKLLQKHKNLGVLVYKVRYNNPEFHNLFKESECLGFAHFPSQVYTNLMSLLHYKRYLLSV
ncbi:MAG: hypothetical protein Q8867_05615 [Bacteroidota bacterium]|nr:hypothetical protein [Bacteroidota bacterium]